MRFPVFLIPCFGLCLFYCTRFPAPLSGCLVVGTACRPARPCGHSPGEERRGGDVQRVQAAGDEEPATKSRASTYNQAEKRDQGDGASGTKWSRARSTVRQYALAHTSSEEAPGYRAERGRGADERRRTRTTAWVGGPVPVTDRWKRAVADRPAGGGRRVVRCSGKTEQ